MTLNGITLNGVTLNGVTLNGVTLNGVTLNGITLNGTSLSALALSGSVLHATGGGGALSGLGLIGAELQLAVQAPGADGPVPYTLKFDNVYIDPNRPGSDIYLYEIRYLQAGGSTWKPVCQDASGNLVAAIPIANYWNLQTGARVDDPNTFTFACINTALGKCVRLGYRPWATASQCVRGDCKTVNLADYHQACTRMLRADYCGNGTAYTVNGTVIEVYDSLQPAIQTQTMHWDVEGKWNPDGALCIGDARHAELLAKGRFPDCNGDGRPGDVRRCGEDSDLSGALLGSTFDKDHDDDGSDDDHDGERPLWH